MRSRLVCLPLLVVLSAGNLASIQQQGPQDPPRPRVIVSTDIGGTDPDDFQSMVHLLLYADRFDIEGLISSPYGPGRREHVLQVLDRYATDYPRLKTHSDRYPPPDVLRGLTRQGAIESAPPGGVGQSTDGSDWIVRRARVSDSRPLWVLVWGGIDDLAQALHDAPDILPKLRVYSARMIFDGRIPALGASDGRGLRFLFSPRDAKVWPYVIRSDFAGLDGQSGQFTAVPPPHERTRRPSSRHPNWWIDDPDPAAAEGIHPGARHVSRWREAFLRDFAARLQRLQRISPVERFQRPIARQ